MANNQTARSASIAEERLDRFSHDMRARLYVINGASELLLGGALGSLNDEQKRSLTDILESGRRLVSLLNSYLEPPPEAGRTDGIIHEDSNRG